MTITSHTVKTARLRTHYLDTGGDGQPILFVHGNASSSAFYRGLLDRLPKSARGLAVDLRGYGDSEPLPIDATRGLGDFSDDLKSFVDALDLGGKRRLILVGWSMGGGVVLRYAIDHPQDVAALVLEAPLPPYGFGGRGLDGQLCYPDGAGSGASMVNPAYVAALSAKDRSADSPSTPRAVMNAFYFKPPFKLSAEEEDLAVSEILKMGVGDDHYPGDRQPSSNWPGLAPGTRGILNSMSGKYCNLSAFSRVQPQPKVLWIRGADDQIVSNTSILDLGFLGQIGAIPGWPGAEVYPALPMVEQTRAMLESFRQNGGSYQEIVYADCGHSPHLEKPDEFLAALTTLL